MKKLLPLLLPAAVLALGSCSSEPSDWRPDKKVSLDMIPPGTRPSDNFDQNTNEAPSADKGGAIPRPVNSGVKADNVENPTAEQVMTADTQEGTGQKKGERDNSEVGDSKKPGGTTEAGGAPGTAGANNTTGTQTQQANTN